MDMQSIIALILVFFFAVFLFLNKKNLKIQKIISYLLYVVMYRTKIGLKLMDNTAKRFPRTIKVIGIIGIIVGFIFMLVITFTLVEGVISHFQTPEAPPSVQPVLPFQAKGVLYVPPIYWIVSIFILAVVHEFSHGILARRYNIPIKSSGFAFLCLIAPIIPAAFVEPDEKKLQKAKPYQQLSIYAAGPLANIILAMIIFVLMIFVVSPYVIDPMMQYNGTVIYPIEGKPAFEAGMEKGAFIESINGIDIDSPDSISRVMEDKKPGEEIILKTEKNEYHIELAESPNNPEEGYIGITLENSYVIKEGFRDKFGNYTPEIIQWFWELFMWLFLLNFGVGLFNLVPLGPIDGGRMLLVALEKFFKKDTAFKIWRIVSGFVLFVLLLNILLIYV